tara:strand:- start:7549 stop:7815 length:267 start_codon:yes stop_codon:yes gene_type:complete
MLKTTKFLFLIVLSLTFLPINAQHKELLDWAESGKVENENYYSEMPFRYINGYIFIDIIQNGGYFGVMVPPVSVKQCHFERYCNYIKN